MTEVKLNPGGVIGPLGPFDHAPCRRENHPIRGNELTPSPATSGTVSSCTYGASKEAPPKLYPLCLTATTPSRVTLGACNASHDSRRQYAVPAASVERNHGTPFLGVGGPRPTPQNPQLLRDATQVLGPAGGRAPQSFRRGRG